MMLFVFQPVTVWTVVHHLPVPDTLLLVNLPEDHPTLPRGTEPIPARRTDHLLPRQIPRLDHRLTELTPNRLALSP